MTMRLPPFTVLVLCCLYSTWIVEALLVQKHQTKTTSFSWLLNHDRYNGNNRNTRFRNYRFPTTSTSRLTRIEKEQLPTAPFMATTNQDTASGNTHDKNNDDTIIDDDSTGSANSFDWTDAWYPVSPIMDLSHDAPNKITLLGMDFVVWFDPSSSAPSHSNNNIKNANNGSWRAFADVCPHRLVPLSEGRIEPELGVLQCAYHGWEFNGDGACVRIPQLPDSSSINSKKSCTTTFPVCVEQDLLWIYPRPNDEIGASRTKPVLIPELDDPSFVDATNFFSRDMPYNWEILVENLCDPTHISFAHHNYMQGSDRNLVDQMAIDITEQTSKGFKARKEKSITGPHGKYEIEFTAPCLLLYRIEGSDAVRGSGSKLGLGSYCIPTSPGNCRLISRFPFQLSFKPAMFFIKNTPRWITHMSQNIVMDSDVIFLTVQDDTLQRLKLQKITNNNDRLEPTSYFMPAKADAMVTAFRTWLNTYGNNGPSWLLQQKQKETEHIKNVLPDGNRASSVTEPINWIRVPGREGRDSLLDRYRQHTEHCSSCRKAHLRLHMLRKIFTSVGICLLAAAAAVTTSGISTTTINGGVVTTSSSIGISKKKITLAIVSAIALLTPNFILDPIIARLECVPWPRKDWRIPTPKELLLKRNKNK